jgi:hypothetical protein
LEWKSPSKGCMGENFSSLSRFCLKVGLSNEAAATCDICDDRFSAFSAW